MESPTEACKLEPIVRDASFSPRKYSITYPSPNDDTGGGNRPPRNLEKIYQTIDSVLAHILGSAAPSVYSETLRKASVLKFTVYRLLIRREPGTYPNLDDEYVRDYFRTTPPNVQVKDLTTSKRLEVVKWGLAPFQDNLKDEPQTNELWLSKDLIDVFLEAPVDSDLEVQRRMIIVITLFREYTHCLLKRAHGSSALLRACGSESAIYFKMGKPRLTVEKLLFGFSLLVDLPLEEDGRPVVRNIAKLIARVDEKDDYELDIGLQRRILDSLRLVKIHQVKLENTCPSVATGCTRVRGLAYFPWLGQNQTDIPSYDPSGRDEEQWIVDADGRSCAPAPLR